MPETNIMIKKYSYTSSVAPLSTLAAALVLTACGGGGGSDSTAVSYSPGEVFKVGTTTYDPALPPEPTLPTDAQVCATLEASPNLVRRRMALCHRKPIRQNRGLALQLTLPSLIRIRHVFRPHWMPVVQQLKGSRPCDAAADAAAVAQQQAAAVPNKNIAGVSGEELAKPQYRGSKFAVRLVVNSKGVGDSFITGPLTLPSGVTLWIDKGVTMYATRDVKAYSPNIAGLTARIPPSAPAKPVAPATALR
jgi:hypothetical protein